MRCTHRVPPQLRVHHDKVVGGGEDVDGAPQRARVVEEGGGDDRRLADWPGHGQRPPVDGGIAVGDEGGEQQRADAGVVVGEDGPPVGAGPRGRGG